MNQLKITPVNYRAPFWAKNRHIQSLLATLKLRRPVLLKKAKSMLEASQEVIIDAGTETQLQGFYSANSKTDSPLVILLHGWEGSHESLYLLSAAQQLFEQGYHVLRLNLRDHGTSHHLNKELFHSNRLEEVVQAIKTFQNLKQPKKLFLVGFSLGGNFTVRVANKAPAAGIKLSKAIAICPAIDPIDILHQLENGLSIYHDYFLKKWKRSLRKKQTLFPNEYDFSKVYPMRSMRQMTLHLLDMFGDYPTMDDYFNGYALTGSYLAELATPTSIIMTEDDPVIGYQDIFKVQQNEYLNIYSSEQGGHCGFIANAKLESWVDEFILQQLRTA